MGFITLTFLGTALVVFTVLFLLFKKLKPTTPPLKNAAYWISSVFAVPIVYAGVVFLYLTLSSGYDKLEFDQKDWEDDPHTRYEYVEDLIDNNKLNGLTRLELLSLLSEPDSETDSTMVFYIGYWPKELMNMDPDWLVVELADERAIQAYVQD